MRGARRRLLLLGGLVAAACGADAPAPDAPAPDAPAPDAPAPDAPAPDAPDTPADASVVGPDSGPSEVVVPCPLVRVGGLDSLAGKAIGIGPDTLLVVNGEAEMHLHIAARRGDTLVPIAATRLPAFVIDSDPVLAQSLDQGVIAVGEGGERELLLASFTPGDPASLQARGTLELGGQLAGLGGSGHRVWICTRDFFAGSVVALVDVSDPDAPAVAGGIVMPRDCGSVAVSDDGNRVFVNTGDGVRTIDAAPLDGGGAPTLGDVFSTPAGVVTSPGFLVLRGADAVRVLRQSDLGEVASIPAGGALAATVAGGRLLVEGFRVVAGGSEGFAALWDVLGATPPAKLDEIVLFTTPLVGDSPPAFRSSVTLDGATLVAELGGRVFDLASGRFVELRVPAATPLGRLYAAAPGARVRAYGGVGAALVDVSDLSAPAFAGGGSFGGALPSGLALDETTAAPHLAFGSPGRDPTQAAVGIAGQPDPLPIPRFRLDDDGRAQVTGSFALPNRGASALVAAGGDIYRLRLPVSPSFDVVLQGFAIASLGSAGEAAAPDFDLPLSPSPPLMLDPKTPFGIFGAFDVDPQARLAVVSTGTIHADLHSADAALFWIDLAATPPRVLEEVRLTQLPNQLRVVGTRAAATTGLGVLFVELGRGQVSELSSGEAFLDPLVGFDGRVATFGQSLPFGIGVAGFGTTGVVLPPLRLDATPQSFIAVGGGFAVGLPSALVTVEPRCD